MASVTEILKLPSICTLYNQKGCNEPNCIYLHICKGFIESTCDGCTLSHDIKSGQPRALLSGHGLDTSIDGGILTEFYRIGLSRIQDTQEPRRFNPPSICFYYNTGKCQIADCAYVHICEKYILDCCDLFGCLLSHAITRGQAWAKLSACGYDSNKTPEEIRAAYRSDLIQMMRKQQGLSSDSNNQEVSQNYEGYMKEEEKVTNQEDRGSNFIANYDTKYPFLVFKDYEKGECNSSCCKHLHCCGEIVSEKNEKERYFKFQTRTESGSSEDEQKSIQDVANIGKISPEEPEIVKKQDANGDNEYEPKFFQDVPKNDIVSREELGIVQNQAARDSNFTGNDDKKYPHIVCRNYNKGTCKSRRCKYLHICGNFVLGKCEKGLSCNLNHRLFYASNRRVLKVAGYDTNQNEEKLLYEFKSDSSGSVTQNYSYLVCRNFNTKGCYYDRCKWLHICNEFVQGKCKKGSSCPKNHMLFYAHNRRVLHTAGFNTAKRELELFMDYIMRLKDEDGINGDGKIEETTQPETEQRSRKKTRKRKEKQPTETKQMFGKPEPMAKISGQRSGMAENEQTNKKATETPKQSQKQDTEGEKDIIIQDEDSEICLNNLRQRCIYGDKCGRHHCNMPYHWQYKAPTRPWTTFPVVVNETLEMNFCDEDTDTAKVSVANEQCTVDFKQMKGRMQDGDILLRRLSTSSFCEAPPGETLVTQWRWYWKDDGGNWHDYRKVEGTENRSEDALCREIEEKYNENPENIISLKIGLYQYIVDFKNTVQIDVKNGTQRVIRRRPVFKSKSEVEKEAKQIRKLDQKQEKTSSQSDVARLLPTWWTHMDDDKEFERVPLLTSDRTYQEVLSLFKKSVGKANVSVSSIERIQNPFLWQNYEWKKQTMEKQNTHEGANEMRLYHGTSEENIDSICKTNFDWRLYGTSFGSIYGKGSYFAADAKYSDLGYANRGDNGFKSVFIVRVLVGKFTKGTPDLRRPPPLDPKVSKGKLYDSTVDDPAKPRVYCIFHDSQYYPEYLIKYR